MLLTSNDRYFKTSNISLDLLESGKKNVKMWKQNTPHSLSLEKIQAYLEYPTTKIYHDLYSIPIQVTLFKKIYASIYC